MGQHLEADSEAAKELEVAKQKVSDQGYVNLGHDGVFGVADEGFDLQVLFDEAEERLDLPAFLVDIGDRSGGQVEVIGQEDVVLAGFLVAITYSAQGDRIIAPFGSGQPDDLIGSEAQSAIDFVALDHLVIGVGLHSGHEENSLPGQGIQPGEGNVCLVHGHDRSFGQGHGLGGFGFMTPGFGN